MNLDKLTWKHIDANEYFAALDIPDDWATLEDFVDWYTSSKMPMMIPWDAEVIRSDDAVAVCLFRKGNYQVEFYLEYPRMTIRKHSHPGMEVITMALGGGSMTPRADTNTSTLWGRTAKKLLSGQSHGGDTGQVVGNGFVTLAFQRWDNQEEMTSAAVQWKGELQGPHQENLIKAHKPDAFVQPGYADVSINTKGEPV